jgi:hypothetical protein
VRSTHETWSRGGQGSQGGSIDDRSDGLNVKRILLSASCTFASFDRSISIRNLLPTSCSCSCSPATQSRSGMRCPLPLLPSPGCYFRFPEAKRAKVVTVLSPPPSSLSASGSSFAEGSQALFLSFLERPPPIIIIMHASSSWT